MEENRFFSATVRLSAKVITNSSRRQVHTGHQACDGQILVEFRLMQTDATTTDFKASSLLRRGGLQSRKPGQGNRAGPRREDEAAECLSRCDLLDGLALLKPLYEEYKKQGPAHARRA